MKAGRERAEEEQPVTDYWSADCSADLMAMFRLFLS
jgi:hypothetical protein